MQNFIFRSWNVYFSSLWAILPDKAAEEKLKNLKNVLSYYAKKIKKPQSLKI